MCRIFDDWAGEGEPVGSGIGYGIVGNENVTANAGIVSWLVENRKIKIVFGVGRAIAQACIPSRVHRLFRWIGMKTGYRKPA